MGRKRTNIYTIRSIVNTKMLKEGYSMQASYFQTDHGYVDYIYTYISSV